MRVYLLQYCHRHGEDFSVYTLESSAQRAAAEIACTYAHELCDAAHAARVNELFAQDRYADCVSEYETHHDNESLTIHPLEVQ